MLGVGGLVLRGVGHGDGGAVDALDGATMEGPGRSASVLEPAGGVLDEAVEEGLGQPPAGAAVTAGGRRATGQPLAGPPGDQTFDGRLTGVVLMKDLGQEPPEDHHRGGDDGFGPVGHGLGGEIQDDLDAEQGVGEAGVQDEALKESL